MKAHRARRHDIEWTTEIIRVADLYFFHLEIVKYYILLLVG